MKIRTVHVTKEEKSLRRRRRLARASTTIDQMERMYLITADGSIVSKNRPRASYPEQTVEGNWLGPVVLPSWSSSWQRTYGEKKEIFGQQRRAVGGITKGEDPDEVGSDGEPSDGGDELEAAAQEETPAIQKCIESFRHAASRGSKPLRLDSQVEPVFFHSLPLEFCETVVADHNLSHVLDLTPREGLLALACLKKKVPHVGICFTETHKALLEKRLNGLVQEEFLEEGGPLYEPVFAELVGSRGGSAGKKKNVQLVRRRTTKKSRRPPCRRRTPMLRAQTSPKVTPTATPMPPSHQNKN